MADLRLAGVHKRFGDTEIIHGVDLEIAHGEFVVFVGPSGCGKSTLLRLVAGLEEISEGRINIGGRDVSDLDPASRGIAMVFQSYALYPHMTVRENISFGLRMNKAPKAMIDERVARACGILMLGELLERRPAQLSGGQRQRVAIGRAIVREPEVFLFDEPLSNLDAELRVQMRVELAELHAQLGATMIYVTHDQVEAMTLADRIVVINGGRIEQVGRPLDLYTRPTNAFVAGFIGSPKMNFLEARVEERGDGSAVVSVCGGACRVRVPVEHEIAAGGRATLGIRPEHLADAAPDETDARLAMAVDISEHLGGVSYVHAHAADGSRLIVERKGMETPERGAAIDVRLAAEACHLFDGDGQRL